MSNRKPKTQKLPKTQKQKLSKIFRAFLIGISLFVFLPYNVNRYEYTDAIFFPLWYVALGLGVIVGVLYAILLEDETSGTVKRIGAGLFIAFMMSWFTGAIFAHLNHFLDFSEPVEYTAVIEEKEYHPGRRRSRAQRTFTLNVDGKTLTIHVPSSHYRNLEEGDLYRVAYHKGAFGEPYYIGVGGVDE